MFYWALIILLGIACLGVISSSIAARRARQQREKEKLYRQAKAAAVQVEAMIDKLLRIECRKDIIDALIKYHGIHTEKMQSLFPNLPEASTYAQSTDNLRALPITSLAECPVEDSKEFGQIQHQIRQFNQCLGSFRAAGLITPKVSDQWSKYLKEHLIKVEIQVLIDESERQLNMNDRAKASNCLRTAESRLEKVSMNKNEKEALRKDIASRIKDMYGLASDQKEASVDAPPSQHEE